MVMKIERGLSLFDSIHLVRTVQMKLKADTLQEFIEIAELEIKKNPDDWVILFELGSKYMDVGRFADSVNVFSHCVRLKPKDAQSAYFLATAYNLFLRGWWTKEAAEEKNIERGLTDFDKINPELAKSELIKAGLTLEEAAFQAAKWFEYAIKLNPDSGSKEYIRHHLRDIYFKFPILIDSY